MYHVQEPRWTGLEPGRIGTSWVVVTVFAFALGGVSAVHADVGCGDSPVFTIDNVAKLVCVESAEFAIDNRAVGDLNCDGAADFGDINPFVLVLSNPAGYYDAYPACNAYNGDMNCDGSVNFGDINPFVACLSSGDCDCP